MASEDIEKLIVEMTRFMREKRFGKYRGVVTQVNDPDTMGRVKAKVPEVYGKEESPWALPSLPFAGDSHGLVVLPEVGDGIWVEFEAGDPARPVWSGCWWASGEQPSPGGPNVRSWLTSGGHQIVLDDDSPAIQITHSGGAQIQLDSNGITLTMGGTTLEVTDSGVSINSGSFEVTT